MANDFNTIYNECLDRLANGLDIGEYIDIYPQYREELESLSKTFLEANKIIRVVPSIEAKTRGRQNLYRELERLRASRSRPAESLLERFFNHKQMWAAVAAIILIVILTTGLYFGFLSDNGDSDIILVTSPTPMPTESLSQVPSENPTPSPVTSPSVVPETSPSSTPEFDPSPEPGITPSATPIISPLPTMEPTPSPTPVLSPSPTPEIESSPTPGPIIVASMGFLEIRVTDAPTHDISAIYLTISDIDIHSSGTPNMNKPDSVNGDDRWETVIPDSHTFELLELRGIEKILGVAELPSGHYSQIRFNIDKVSVTINEKTQEAKLPSDTMKLTGAFTIEKDQKTAITLDFDAEQSMTVSGNNKPIFKPVVRVIVTQP